MAQQPGVLPRSCSAKDINCDSASASRIPQITFVAPQAHESPIGIFRCSNIIGTLLKAKQWHLQQFRAEVYGNPSILRMEELDLHTIDKSKDGNLLWLDNAAKCDGVPISILALLVPGDHHVRFFYSAVTHAPLLDNLERGKGYIKLRWVQEPRVRSGHRILNKRYGKDPKAEKTCCDHHCSIFVYIREEFKRAILIADSSDYMNAMSLTDYAPDILDPNSAVKRLEACEYIHFNPPQGGGTDLSDDRYLLKLHPAERELASISDLKCAEYLLIKRNFFKDFYAEAVKTDKKIDPNSPVHVDGGGLTRRHRNEVVRTDYAHRQYLERVYEWPRPRAQRLITGWRVLGLLEEARLLPWIKAGGMFANELARKDEEGNAATSVEDKDADKTASDQRDDGEDGMSDKEKNGEVAPIEVERFDTPNAP